jgi:hypothetical protein
MAKRVRKRRWPRGLRTFAFAFLELPASVITRNVPVRVIRRYYRQFLPRLMRCRRVREDTIYVFTFLGEFGYELFNWQGVIRKFATQLPDSSEIVVAGRKDLDAFYETASMYIDISDYEPYRQSIAAGYFALPPDILRRHFPPSPRELAFDAELKDSLIRWLGQKIGSTKKRIEFIFSSELSAFPGCNFGVDRHYYARRGHPGRIYSAPELLENNKYKRIDPDPKIRAHVEEKLGFGLEQPYFLVQSRRRQIGPQAGLIIRDDLLIEELSRRIVTVVLSFTTGRLMDSFSKVMLDGDDDRRVVRYPVESFREQGCLIAHADKCIFVSEGDLGSHTYLPPFMGKDVIVLASEGVFDLPSAPIDFWNRYVFRFGGQMIPLKAESLFESPNSLCTTISRLIAG